MDADTGIRDGRKGALALVEECDHTKKHLAGFRCPLLMDSLEHPLTPIARELGDLSVQDRWLLLGD